MSTVIDAGDLRKYRTEIPNIVDDMGLSVYAFRLYVHLKRVAGDSGRCFQGKRKMAEVCGMSPAMITNAKRELVEQGLIVIAEPGNSKTSTADTIVIVDIWRENFAAFAKAKPGHGVTTPGQDMTTPGHTVDGGGHMVDPKKEPVKKEPFEESSQDDEERRTFGAVIAAWQDNIRTPIGPMMSDALHELVTECGAPAVIHGISVAAMKGIRDVKYVSTVARNHVAGTVPPPRAQPTTRRSAPMSKVAGSLAAVDEIEAMLKEGKL